jgi:imidazolonepropionase
VTRAEEADAGAGAKSGGADVLITARRLVRCDGGSAEGASALGASDDAAVLVSEGCVVAVGEAAELSRAHPRAERWAADLVTPGLVDAHTHAVWVGSRAGEYAQRMAGADYEEIARAGGGIVASMRAVRAASVGELEAALAARLRRMARMGVTAVEVKSGYGLSELDERKQLEAVARVRKCSDLPRVVPTFLGLHALPPEAGGDGDGYAAACRDWLTGIAADGLARFVDAYVDRNAFSVRQARAVLERARALGLGVRIHGGQLADVGAAELAVDLGAASIDHLEHVSEAGARALGRAGVVVVLLPTANFTLGQPPPPVALLRAAGCVLAVASDSNPGTAPTESLPLALALAVRSYGLTVAEAVVGATAHAARSLDLPAGCGTIRVGAPADLVLWDLPHENDLVQPWGVPRARAVLRDGVLIAGSRPL